MSASIAIKPLILLIFPGLPGDTPCAAEACNFEIVFPLSTAGVRGHRPGPAAVGAPPRPRDPVNRKYRK